MPKVLRYTLPVVACLCVVSSSGTPAGGEGTAGSRARAIHTARAPQVELAPASVVEPTLVSVAREVLDGPVPAVIGSPVLEPARVAAVAPKVRPIKPVPTVPPPNPNATNNPLVPGHWWCATNGACYRDPDPLTEMPYSASHPDYEAGLNAELCIVKPAICSTPEENQ